MNRTMLVPLDGSTWSEHALPIAGMIARSSGATVHLVHVYVPIVSVSVGGYGIGGVPIVDDSWNAERREQANVYLKAQVQKLGTECDGSTTTAILDGPVIEALAEHIALISPDLVVMTTHGRGGLARLWLGSVADGLVHHSTVPILLVRPHEHTAEPQPGWPFKQILAPLDGSTLAEQILEPALMLGRPMRATYTLVRVVEPFVAHGYSPLGQLAEVAEQATSALCDEAKQYLERVAERLRAEDVVVSTRIIIADHPASAILNDAREHGADLITMATHGRGGLARLLIGSVADKVLRGADSPVLLFQPRGER